MRLMIVTLLISLTLPIALSTLEGFQNQAQVRSGIRLADEIGSAASSIYASGKGNVRVVELDWPDGQQGEVIRLRLAGPVGSAISTRLDIVVNGQVSAQVFLSDPMVHLATKDSNRIEIGPDCKALKLSCVVEASQIWVSVEVV